MIKPPHPGCVEIYYESDGKRWLHQVEMVPPADYWYVQIGGLYVPVVKSVCILDRDGFIDVEIDYGPKGEELRVIPSPQSNCPK